MTTTKDRWRRGERVRHPTHGEARVAHVEASGIAYARSAAGAYLPMQTITAEHEAARGWRRDHQGTLFPSSFAAASSQGSWT